MLMKGLDILVSNAAVNPFFGRALDCPEESEIHEIKTRVGGITRSVSAWRMEGDGFDAWPKPCHS